MKHGFSKESLLLQVDGVFVRGSPSVGCQYLSLLDCACLWHPFWGNNHRSHTQSLVLNQQGEVYMTMTNKYTGVSKEKAPCTCGF